MRPAGTLTSACKTHFRLPASRTGRTHISAVLSHQLCGTRDRSHGERTHHSCHHCTTQDRVFAHSRPCPLMVKASRVPFPPPVLCTQLTSGPPEKAQGACDSRPGITSRRRDLKTALWRAASLLLTVLGERQGLPQGWHLAE